MADEGESTRLGELEATLPGGAKLRAKGYRLMDIICLFGFLIAICTLYLVFEHKAEAKDDSKKVAEALRESNKEVADTLKSTTKETNTAIKEMAQALRETNCLLALPPDRRGASAAEVCKRLARDR